MSNEVLPVIFSLALKGSENLIAPLASLSVRSKWHKMNLTHLKFVKATAEHKSFSRAAEECHVTQPTLSNGVSKIEEELGEKIFFRTTREVKLTAFGEILLPTIISMARLEKAIFQIAKDFSNPETVVLKIGMSPLVNSKIISPLINSFKAQNSKHDILLIEENLNVLEEKLENQELDIILVPVINKTANKNVAPLYKEDLFFIDAHHAATETSIQIDAIRGETFVMVPDSCGLSEITRLLLRTTRKEIKEYEGKALSYQVLADWATNGLGAAILPRSKILPHISKRQICLSDEPAQILFEARWSSTANKPLRNLILHFKKNINSIVTGMVG